jgi:hypothetical protein
LPGENPNRRGAVMEFGIAHNQCSMTDNSSLGYNTTINRNAIFLRPAMRLGYGFQLFEKIPVNGFAGFAVNGGRSAELSNGYRSKMSLYNFEIGLIPQYFYRNFSLGIGIKYNRLLLADSENYGYKLNSIDGARAWQKISWISHMSKNNWDLGMRIGYHFKKTNLVLEYWKSINNFAARSIANNVIYKQMNFRIILGYFIK